MISIYKNIDEVSEIIVRCSKSERLDILKIKGIVHTIRKIDKHNSQPCKIMVKGYSNMQFTRTGEQFYKRVFHNRNAYNRISICFD